MARSVHSTVVANNLAGLRDYLLRHQRMEMLPRIIDAIELTPPDANGRMSLEANTRNIHRIAEIIGDPCLGLDLSAHLPSDRLALLESVDTQLGPASDQLRQHPLMVMRLLERYLRLFSEVVELQCHVTRHHYRLTLTPYSDAVSHHQTDGALISLHRIFTRLSREALESVRVTHQASPDMPARYADQFGVTPTFNDDAIELIYTNTSRTVADVNDYLATVARNESTLLEQFPEMPFSERCRGVIRLLLALGEPRREHLCLVFKTSLPTLKRRLQAEQTCYASLVREVRQDLARQYARNKALPVTEAALLLGYQDIHQYSRAFKTWFGFPPSEASQQASWR